MLDKTTRSKSAQAYYEDEAASLFQKYEGITFEQVHADLINVLPSMPGSALDIGAGSGRDADWLSRRGWQVVAAEPSRSLLTGAQSLHNNEHILWLKDSLPGMHRVRRLRRQFQLILLSAVWMHVTPGDRPTAFANVVRLLAPNGLLNVTLRMGGMPKRRGFFRTNVAALRRQAIRLGLAVVSDTKSHDMLGRREVTWHSLIFRR
jgi:SAM-dependent methyltransferase